MDTQEIKKKMGLSKEPISKLAVEASVGFFSASLQLAEYILVWYVCYPILFFASLHLVQLFLVASLDYASIEFFFHVFVAVLAIPFFGIKLINRCIVTKRTSREYLRSTPEVWVEVFLYLAINMISFARLGIPLHMMILHNRAVAFDLKLFMALYTAVLFAVKYYHEKYFN